MRLEWQELEAVRRADGPMRRLLGLIEAQDERGARAYLEGLPADVQGALGYVFCLCEAAERCAHMPGLHLSPGPEERLLAPYRPIAFLGWAGWHNDVGPAYAIDGARLCGQASRLFYTDDDIECRKWLARARAMRVERESSGIADVRVELLPRLRRMDTDLVEERWCITFTLDAACKRPVAIMGEEVRPKGASAVLVLPWAGEFNCLLGEIVAGDAYNAFVLASHSYCMK